MNTRLSTFSAAAFLLATTMALAQDQPAPGNMMPNQGMEMMGQGGEMMGVMPQRMMGQGMMHPRLMMKLMMILMDTNGDGAVSLEEFEAAHTKIFKAIDGDNDGKISTKEVEKFLSDAALTDQ